MGHFDFLRRKAPQLPDPNSEQLDYPRCHHYALAHVALRSAAFCDPLGYLSVLASPKARRFPARLLRSVSDSEHCRQEEPQPDFTIEDIAVHLVRAGRYPCAVIELPRPKATTEAYFTAAVLLAVPEDGMPETAPLELRYFTLEKGFVLAGPPRTVLCEWTFDGTHLTFGDGPATQLEAFVRAVEELASMSK
jgi:hypothetical protein